MSELASFKQRQHRIYSSLKKNVVIITIADAEPFFSLISLIQRHVYFPLASSSPTYFLSASFCMLVYEVFVSLLAAVIVSAIIATTRGPLDSCHRALKALPHSDALPLWLDGSACMAITGNKRIMRADRTKKNLNREWKKERRHTCARNNVQKKIYLLEKLQFYTNTRKSLDKETSPYTAVSIFFQSVMKRNRERWD